MSGYEKLDSKWIDEHKKGMFMDGKGRKKHFVWVDDLQDLFVPEQEVTEEQAMEWLDNNDFYDHATAERVLENAVDKGELGYYGTKYSVVKKEPETVADVITTFRESYERLKEVMSMEVEELEDGIDSAISDIENGRINTYKSFDELLKELEE